MLHELDEIKNPKESLAPSPVPEMASVPDRKSFIARLRDFFRRPKKRKRFVEGFVFSSHSHSHSHSFIFLSFSVNNLAKEIEKMETDEEKKGITTVKGMDIIY